METKNEKEVNKDLKILEVTVTKVQSKKKLRATSNQQKEQKKVSAAVRSPAKSEAKFESFQVYYTPTNKTSKFCEPKPAKAAKQLSMSRCESIAEKASCVVKSPKRKSRNLLKSSKSSQDTIFKSQLSNGQVKGRSLNSTQMSFSSISKIYPKASPSQKVKKPAIQKERPQTAEPQLEQQQNRSTLIRQQSLAHAIALNNIFDVQKLLSTNIAINYTVGQDGESLLHLAIQSNSVQIADLLLKTLKFSINIRDRNQLTPLHTAMRLPQIELSALLFAYGADANPKDKDGQTPLHHAVIFGNYDQVKFLISQNVDLEVTDNHSRTPLHYAAVYKRIGIAESLINEGVKVNPKDKLSQTPLLLACRSRSYNMVELLLQNGAITEGYDYFGKNACRYAIEAGRFDIVDLFKTPTNQQKYSQPGSNIYTKYCQDRSLHTLNTSALQKSQLITGVELVIELYHANWLKIKESKTIKERCIAYALYKQATRGDAIPSSWSGSIWTDKYKLWEAWNSQRGLPQSIAREEYIEFMQRYFDQL